MINYIKQNQYKIKIFLLFGNNENTEELLVDKKDMLILNVVDNLIPGILQKTIKAFEYINVNYQYKHIIRTNLSSFFIVDELVKISNSLDSNNLYASLPLINHAYRHYVGQVGTGCGFWLSKDNIEYILNNENKINYTVADDIAIGKIMESKKFTKLKRIDIVSSNSWISGADLIEISSITNDVYKSELLTKIINYGHYHIRIKVEKDRNIDIDFMKYFTKILYI